MQVSGPAPAGGATVGEVAPPPLSGGRLLFQNGSDTAQVQRAVTRFAAAFGCEVHLLVTYEALLLTAVAGGQFRTKVTNRVPSLNVNPAGAAAANRLPGGGGAGRRAVAGGRAGAAGRRRLRP